MLRKNCFAAVTMVVAALLTASCTGTPVSPEMEFERPGIHAGAAPALGSGIFGTASVAGLSADGEFRCVDLAKYKLWIDVEYLSATLNYEIEGLPGGNPEGYLLQVWWFGHSDNGSTADPGTYDPSVSEMNAGHRVYNIGHGPNVTGSQSFTYPESYAGKKLKVVIYLQPKRERLSDDPIGQCDRGRYVTPELPPPPPPGCTGPNCNPDPPCQGEECDPEPPCEGEGCEPEPPCVGEECDPDPPCQGEECNPDPPCEGEDCDEEPPCEGQECEPEPPQCPAPSEQNFSLPRPIGNPTAECSYFGSYTPNGEGTPSFYVTKCGLFYEVTHGPWDEAQCSNGQLVSHSTPCYCSVND